MKEELEKYFRKASAQLEEAELMLERGMLNGAANRAYYAMFSSICAALFVHGIFTKSHSGAHGKFRELYLKSNLLPIEFNHMLTAVFELRTGADYDIEILEDKEVATEAVDFAKQFCGAVRELLIKTTTA
ncbi:MAG: HEPN domain-containing protein [Bacteroidetes bacterium]|nr:HEPN domain-containing protein [Bacteroidota bacterium]